MTLIFDKFEKLPKPWINILQAWESRKDMDLIFLSLKKLNKHEFNFLQAQKAQQTRIKFFESSQNRKKKLNYFF